MADTVGVLPVATIDINYEDEIQKISDFLTKFVAQPRTHQANGTIPGDDDEAAEDDTDAELEEAAEGLDVDDAPGRSKAKYMRVMRQVANRKTNKVVIDLKDLQNFSDDQSLLHNIMGNARRYIQLFADVLDKLMPAPDHDLDATEDVLDMIIDWRRRHNEAGEDDAEAERSQFPPELMRRFNVFFRPPRDTPVLAVRAVRAANLGHLITVRGIVTRVSEVKPLLLVNAYTCTSCGDEIFQEVGSKSFTPLTVCPSQTCQTNQTNGQLHMQTRASRFQAFQEVKIQEMADQVPVGHIPRSMTVHLYGALTRSINPGDVVNLSGIFLPTPYTGFRAVRAGLLQDTFLEVTHVHQLKKQYENMRVTPEIEAALDELAASGGSLYTRLANSIAPEIYGHEDVKKALLLLLIGGVTKTVGDGMKIRGDLNVCLMGDPGVAKSQLLKYITKIAPRGVYTTGRGSSGVGLTAAVMRDPVTDEMVLEGGALVLADNGICCIDEFDKMDDSDRTAIHEVMEQQTISISKAGISTTLNARTSILAAANPLYGRYNPKVSPVENINLPAALLSRFDILFLILDTPTREDDERLAQHVTWVHMHNEAPELDFEAIEPTLMRHYIARCRKIRPTVPAAISEQIVNAYVEKRREQKEAEAEDKSFTYVSARTLLGVLRLSQALARLRLSDTVCEDDVVEALRLIDVSKASLLDNSTNAGGDTTDTSKIFRIIKDMASGRGEAARRRAAAAARGEESDEDDEDEGLQELSMVDVRSRVIAKGFTEQKLIDTITEYENMGVLMRTANETRLRFVDAEE